MIVRKRDGRLEEFDSDKILGSIKLAALAVEGKDPDIQRKSNEIQGLKRQLINHGFSEEQAEEQAEEQFEGYIEDGIYTEYDEDEALEILDMVSESIDGLGLDDEDILDTSTIQDLVEKAMMETGHAKTAKEYIIKRANRERIREMNTSLMRSFEDLTFGKSEEVETKRENANIDGDSSMGTMLKYGSEGAKKFNLLYVVPPEESEAHSKGDIHIHDLDFYALTETCILGQEFIDCMSKDGTEIKLKLAKDIDRYFSDGETGFKDVSNEDIYVNSWDTNTKVNKVARHLSKEKKLYTFMIMSKCYGDSQISVTGEHQVPILKRDKLGRLKYITSRLSELTAGCMEYEGLLDEQSDELNKLVNLDVIQDNIELVRAFDITTSDFVVYADIDSDIDTSDLSENEYIRFMYKSAKKLKFEPVYEISTSDIEDSYVYDLETESHYFNIGGHKVVHNCCQIDIEKLFNGGFNTGHGFLREPGEIRSYAALACIAIQSNQNDQHKRVA